jgi:HAD superfamily hydrolase (TIGR01450 family)
MDDRERAALADPPALLRQKLSGVRALLLDMDGVLVLRGKALPGAEASVDRLRLRAIPFRLVTNTSLVSRTTLSAHLAEIGLDVPAPWIVSAVSATAAYTAQRFADRPLYVLASPDSRTEFAGQRLLTNAEAGRRGADAAAVVVGDAAEEFRFETLDAAFRLVRGGARLVGMHRNRWWLTPAGETLDSGAFVRALEYATERRALLIGKPATAFFRAALADLRSPAASTAAPLISAGPVSAAAPAGAPAAASAPGPISAAAPSALVPGEVAMVGDDVWADIAGARRVGLRTVFVLSGKHGGPELAAAARRPRPAPPDVVAPTLWDVVAALD